MKLGPYLIRTQYWHRLELPPLVKGGYIDDIIYVTFMKHDLRCAFLCGVESVLKRERYLFDTKPFAKGSALFTSEGQKHNFLAKSRTT